MRVALPFGAMLWVLLSACALAGTPERDKAWDDLIAQAKAHGGAETKLDLSTSYVFQRPDGSYLALTLLLKSDKGRSVCLIAKDENATACVDWDTGRLKLGSRADAATPWKFKGFESLDAFEKAQPGLVDRLFSSIQDLFAMDAGPHGYGGYGGGTWQYRNGGVSWANRRH